MIKARATVRTGGHSGSAPVRGGRRGSENCDLESSQELPTCTLSFFFFFLLTIDRRVVPLRSVLELNTHDIHYAAKQADTTVDCTM